MSEKAKRQKTANLFPHETTWLREFVGCYGTDGVTSFCEDDLRGVSLVRVLEALIRGKVTSSEKCDGPGTVCVVEHREDDGYIVVLTVHFVSNEAILTIRGAEEVREPDNETDHAA